MVVVLLGFVRVEFVADLYNSINNCEEWYCFFVTDH